MHRESDPTPDTVHPSTVEPGASPVTPVATSPVRVAAEEEGGRRLGMPLAIALAVVAVLAGSGLFLSGYSIGRSAATTPGTPAAETEAFQAFWDAYHAVTDRYAGGPVDRKVLVEGAIKGMIASLDDPYSQYLTSQEYKDSLRGISGEFEGIGAEIGTRTKGGKLESCTPLGPECRLVITSPLDGSPSKAAGLLADDAIVAVDGTSLDGLTVDQARDKIRGPKDTTVTLSILRGDEKPFAVDVRRAVIVQQEVISEVKPGNIGYIKLTGFSEHAADELTKVVGDDVKAGRTKLILDLRGNPGGFVTAAREIASQFLATGPIFWQQDAAGNQVETDAEAGGAATDPGVQLMVLIDKGSASASEIVAGALQDRGRATLIGETASFGKGTVQQWTPLEGDHGGFRLTIAKWLTPDKRWIHGTGLIPDITVTPPAELTAGQDPVLDRALEELGADATGGSTPGGVKGPTGLLDGAFTLDRAA
jgi:carboxyl-terminal processing protease